MKLNRRGIMGLGALALAVAAGGTAFAATSQAGAVPLTAATHIQNDGDQGDGGNTWAVDQIDRAVTITAATPNTAPSGFVAYTVTVTDAGTFKAVQGALTPNQVIPGQKIAHAVSGNLAGTATYAVVAPSAASLGDTFPANVNDNFAHVATGPQSLPDWPVQGFTPQAGVAVTLEHFSYAYTTPAGESWTDSDTTGSGSLVSDGNITGLVVKPPKLPVLSHGHGTATAPTRATVTFEQSGAPSWVEFYIVGYGPINGHTGWVYGHLGLNTGYYSGLTAGHDDTAYYVPVEGQGSKVQIPGTHAGHVDFVS